MRSGCQDDRLWFLSCCCGDAVVLVDEAVVVAVHCSASLHALVARDFQRRGLRTLVQFEQKVRKVEP